MYCQITKVLEGRIHHVWQADLCLGIIHILTLVFNLDSILGSVEGHDCDL